MHIKKSPQLAEFFDFVLYKQAPPVKEGHCSAAVMRGRYLVGVTVESRSSYLVELSKN